MHNPLKLFIKTKVTILLCYANLKFGAVGFVYHCIEARLECIEARTGTQMRVSIRASIHKHLNSLCIGGANLI